jgi:hypothetical protein
VVASRSDTNEWTAAKLREAETGESGNEWVAMGSRKGRRRRERKMYGINGKMKGTKK